MENLKFIKDGTELLYNNGEYCSAVCNLNLDITIYPLQNILQNKFPFK